MGRAPCCSKVGLHRGPWTAREDALLIDYIQCHGEGNWRSLPKNAGLLRCPKSCRLRWMNYLRPDIKRGNIGPEEEDLIIRLHSLLGNRWSLIAGRLPGRTDNEIKNYWNSHLSKKLKKQGIEVREGNTKSFPKRSKSSQKKNEKQKKQLPIKEHIKEDPKTIIHAPKPTRFTPNLRSMSSSSNNAPDWSQVSDRNVGNIASEGDIGDISWPDVDIEGDHGFQNNNFGLESDFQYGLFDRVYHEYSQLLNTEVDQFPVDFLTAEPLLI